MDNTPAASIDNPQFRSASQLSGYINPTFTEDRIHPLSPQWKNNQIHPITPGLLDVPPVQIGGPPRPTPGLLVVPPVRIRGSPKSTPRLLDVPPIQITGRGYDNESFTTDEDMESHYSDYNLNLPDDFSEVIN